VAINKNFVVKNGFEVASDLILANASTKKVGIGSTNPRYNLDVRGGIGATDVIVSGITTVINELRVGTGGTIFSVIAGPTGFGQSVGVGTANPAFLLDVRSPVSTGQTALYVQGDVRITGDLVVDDLTFDDAIVQDLKVTDTFVVGANGGPGIATITVLGVTGLTTTNQLIAYGISTFREYAQFIDNKSLYFGDGSDLNIYHDGSNSYIQEQGQGSLYIQSTSGSVNIRTNSTENAVVANQDGSVELYYDNAKKFETVSAGATVTGTLFTNQLSVSGISTLSNVDINAGDIEVSNVDTTDLNVTGITTTNTLNIGATQVISAARQLQNIASLDATTTATIEAAIANGPNTFTDLTVTGITTLGTVKVSSGIITATTGIVTYYGNGSYLTGNARNLTATIGIGTSGSVVGYGVSFLDLRGPGLSTVYYNNNVGIATIYFQGGGGGATIGIGTTPGEAFTGIVTAGNLWYNSTLGRTFIYYQDVDSAQWVDASPSNVGIITSLTNVSFAPGSASSPSMYFIGDPQTGFFSPGAGQFTVVSTGSSILNINPSGINVTGIVTSTRLSTGNVVSSGIVTAQDFDALSDQRYKENVNTVNNALLKVEQLRGVKFDWKESGLPSYGVIAQELEQVLPELVHGNDPKTVNYNGIIGVLIEAIKELKAEVEELKNAK
jgi:Chaperone of endosialidase